MVLGPPETDDLVALLEKLHVESDGIGGCAAKAVVALFMEPWIADFSHISYRVISECEIESEAHAMAVHATESGITHTVHVVNLEELQDVVHTHEEFPIGLNAMHEVALTGESKELGVVGILWQEGVVLVGEMAYHALYSYHLAELEFVDERQTVEKFSVHIPFQDEDGHTVVEELHIVHQRERA